MDIAAYEASIKRLARAREERKKWDEIEKTEREKLIAAIGVGVGTIDGAPVVMVTENSRKHFDQASLKRDHPRVHARYVTETEFVTVRLI